MAHDVFMCFDGNWRESLRKMMMDSSSAQRGFDILQGMLENGLQVDGQVQWDYPPDSSPTRRLAPTPGKRHKNTTRFTVGQVIGFEK